MMIFKNFRPFFTAAMLIFLFGNQVVAAETGTAIKEDTLRAQPFTDAKSSGSVKRGDALTIIKKQGAWLQVKTSKSTGWLKLLAVKRASSTSTSTASVLNQNSGRAGTGQIVSTTGIRGLSEEELKAATFNESEINLMESYTTSSVDAEKFAKSGALKTVPFAELVEIKPSQPNNALPFGGAK